MRLGILALLFCQIALAQPQPPVLKLADDITGRFEFAPIPELVFVRGIPETMQLGAFQLDPDNRWTPGDFSRASGWNSRRLTRLIDASTGLEATMFSYDGVTGALTYTGTWSGDIAARIETVDGTARSKHFRIRVLTPSVVWGAQAGSINTQYGWDANVCEGIAFSSCRANQFRGGSTDGAPLVVFITPGRYGGQDWFLGSRRFVYVLGNPVDRPILVGDDLASTKFEIWQARNLVLDQTHIVQAGARTDADSFLTLSNIRQCCETRDRNGIVNPHSKTEKPWTVTLWQFESVGMGSPGNTVHAIYAEGRPLTALEIINSRWMGSRGSSSVKTTMQHVAIRHSLFSVSENVGDISSGMLTHSPIDIPAVCNLTVYGNEFYLWRGSTVGTLPGRQGVLAGAIFLRLRKPMLGSDIPAYPDLSWSPPRTSQNTQSSPGGGWPSGPETFVSDDFWLDVAMKPITDSANVFSFKHFISFNRFIQLPGSLPVLVIRDDGTHPVKAVDQFGAGQPLRTHPLWVERSMNFLHGNELVGFGTQTLYRLNSSENMVAPEPGAKWPRDADEEFPHLTELQELPEWFRL